MDRVPLRASARRRARGRSPRARSPCGRRISRHATSSMSRNTFYVFVSHLAPPIRAHGGCCEAHDAVAIRLDFVMSRESGACWAQDSDH